MTAPASVTDRMDRDHGWYDSMTMVPLDPVMGLASPAYTAGYLGQLHGWLTDPSRCTPMAPTYQQPGFYRRLRVQAFEKIMAARQAEAEFAAEVAKAVEEDPP
jgi:hypothetical protein